MDWKSRLLCAFGLSAAGTAFGDMAVFARQFARDTTTVELPVMVYDPERQVMVDPTTRQPLYSRADMVAASPTDDNGRKPKPLPTVTAGCPDCPKCDDNCG